MSAAGALAISIPCIVVGSCCAFAYRNSLKRGWRRLRVRTLGGVTTLERKLSYKCTICMRTMDAGEVVRTLSCNHVFHCRDRDNCREGHIDRWLRDDPKMSCPICRKTPRLVLPWKEPPPASPESANQESSSPSSGLEDTAPPQSPPDLEDPPLPRSPPVLEEPLLQPPQ